MFENGWICGSCWCSNRETDATCYRCHAERPDYGHVEMASKPSEAPSKLEIPERAPVAPAAAVAPVVPSAPVGSVAKAATVAAVAAVGGVEPGVSYCMSCGHRLRDRANYCTQCGATVAGEEPAAVAAAPLAAPPAVATPSVPTPPALTPAVTKPTEPRPDPRAAAAAKVARLRTRFVSFVERHEVRWELAMAGLAVLFALVTWAAGELGRPFRGMLGSVGVVITAFFVVEFVSRLAAAEDRRAHLKRHVIDLIALVPFVRLVRVLSLAYLLPRVPAVRRLAARASAMAESARSVRSRLLARASGVAESQRSSRTWLLAAWAGVAVVSVLLLFGYADAAGMDMARRLVASVMVVAALGAFGALTSAVTAHFVSRRQSETDAPSAVHKERTSTS